MRKTFLFLFTIILFQSSFGQISKGNWLVGGSGQLSAYSSTNTNVSPAREQNVKALYISVSPNIGYFIKDKFAVGLRPALTWEKGKAGDAFAPDGSVVGSGGKLTQIRFVIGPFCRYYLLDTEKPFNILIEAAYQYGIGSPKPLNERQSIFSAGLGPVIYFNSSVGLEFLLGYNNTILNAEGYYRTSKNSIQLNIGVQIHLEK
ncbi:MAG: hypothetical protein J0L83_04510 [Chitinophagales bacterium]|nr:hypothetical protein [Chitinophagales bacterium]